MKDTYEEAYSTDLNSWLDVNEPRISFRFPESVQTGLPDTSAKGESEEKEKNRGDARSRPPKQQVFQEEEIIRVIIKCGYDPKALPPNQNGKPGVKLEVRSQLIFTSNVFDKAWQRLLDSKAIQRNK